MERLRREREPVTEVTVSKLEAARRQLETAITLYFAEGDEVSTHTLGCAAYEVIQDLNRKRTGLAQPDDLMLKDMGRRYLKTQAAKKQFYDVLQGPQNFFKHADRGSGRYPEVGFQAD
jgi:hypothetical protein